jgi:hypothetical protein
MRKPRVSYQMMERGLGTDPKAYLRELRAETGLAWWKLNHDMGKDAGVKVHNVTACNWGRESNGD